MKVSTGEKEMSTTMALVRMFTNLLRDKNVSPRLVPIIPDEARTFGMEGMFQARLVFIHSAGQLYEPQDSASSNVLIKRRKEWSNSRGRN